MMKRCSGNPNETFTSTKKQRHDDDDDDTCIQPPLDHPWILRCSKTPGTSGYICCNTSPALYTGFSTRFPDDFDVDYVFNCCYGWLIFLSPNSLSLWNPVMSKVIKLSLPELKKSQRICGAVLTSPGNRTGDLDLDCRITAFIRDYDPEYPDLSHTSIIYCLLGEKLWNWVFYDDAEITPHIKCTHTRLIHPIVLNDLVYFESSSKKKPWIASKLYCINPTGNIVVAKYCDLPRISDGEGYLVESCGELFFIIIVRETYNYESATHFKALKFDQIKMTWNRVREVGDRVFFIDDRTTVSCDARRENRGGYLYCIMHLMYITRPKVLYSYCFADNSLSTTTLNAPWSTVPTSFNQHVLYFPDTRFIDEPDFHMNLVEMGKYQVDARTIREETNNCKINKEQEEEERTTLLFCLPHALIQFITEFLDPVDLLNFRSVSKICRILAPQIEWREKAPVSNLSPWLVSSGNYSGIYNFVDSKLGGKYLINTPKSLVNAEIIDSNSGWLLLMSNSFRTLHLYNPFTTEIVKLPKLHAPRPTINSSNIGLSKSPSSLNWIVVAIAYGYNNEFAVYVLEVGKERWGEYFFDDYPAEDTYGFRLVCRPVFQDGEIYVLGITGNLRVVKFQDDEPIWWDALGIAKDPSTFLNQNFLLVCDGKVLAISFTEVGKSLSVVALNKTTMSWEKVDNFGGHTVYISACMSFSTPARANWMKDIIIFTRVIDEDSIVYYSMNTRNFHTGADKGEVVEYGNTRELLCSSWIQPSWS